MELRENERIDDLQRKGYRIIQNRDKFCFGVDAVLLSWFAKVKPGERAVDLGTGNGIVPLLLDARFERISCLGLEIQEDIADMARRSVELNGAGERISILTGDIRTASADLGKAVFDVVTTNPPYMAPNTGMHNSDDARAIARHEILCTLEDVVREASLLLHPGGRFYMIHRPGRLPEILESMRAHKLVPAEIRFVHPYADREATMVLVSGKKNGKNVLHVLPPVVIYGEDGNWSPMISEIYGDGRH